MGPDEDALEQHDRLSLARLDAFIELFGGLPVRTHPASPGTDPLVDVWVFAVEGPDGPMDIAVTNGMSDRPMVDEGTGESIRRELIQYFRRCTRPDVLRLAWLGWLPHADGFLLDERHTVQSTGLHHGAPNAWCDSFFVESIINQHRDFELTLDGDPMSLLWHIPISVEEREYKQEHGPNALLDLMSDAGLPWIYDEDDRPPLLPAP